MYQFRLRKILLFIFSLLLINGLFFSLYIPPIIGSQIKNSTTINNNQLSNEVYRSFDYNNNYYILYQNTKDSYNPSLYDLEHIYCLSWAKDKTKNLYDPFNLRLSSKIVNSTRGNNYFGEVKDKDTAKKITYNNEVLGYIDTTKSIFEPVYDKGDIARAILYMHVVYNLPYPYISTMRKWALLDKPQEDEINHYKNVISKTTQNNILIKKYLLASYII